MANLVFLNVTNLTDENLLKCGILGFLLQIKSRVSIGDGVRGGGGGHEVQEIWAEERG